MAAGSANSAGLDEITNAFEMFHDPNDDSQVQLLKTLTAFQVTCKDAVARRWKIRANQEQFEELMKPSTYLQKLAEQCDGFARTHDAKFRKTFPKSTVRTMQRLKGAVDTINSQLVRLQTEDEQQIASISLFPTLTSSSNGSRFALERKEEKKDSTGYGAGTVQRGSLKDALQELRYFERLVKPDAPNYIKKYRNNLIDLKKFRVLLDSVEMDKGVRNELIVCAVNFSFLRSYASHSVGENPADIAEIEKSFWEDKIKKAPRGIAQQNLENAILGFAYRALDMNKQERHLLQLFVQARECVENLRSCDLLDTEAFFIDGIIGSYLALDQLLDPLIKLADAQEDAKELVEEIHAANVVVNAGSTDGLLQFKDRINGLFERISFLQSVMNKSAIRRARELVDSIEFCGHLLASTFMLTTSLPLSPINSPRSASDGSAGRLKIDVANVLEKANALKKANNSNSDMSLVDESMD
eukprot:TRINITY_DN7391_c0_g1_i1.p1 TRINITY_DN7391_c0_g1~~TRINITY_DN7391_c0_g1_i1.p1  ORF type:complete len:470 (+),score=144.68 TRINITY_DN7391_c0_g1_i1:132-1541(+)